MISGIYKWTSPSGKSYVGQAINLKKRARQFKTVKYYTNNGSAIDNARSKYNDFTKWQYEILEECDIDHLNEKEIFWINELETYTKGYNSTKGGDGTKGVVLSEERKEKLRSGVLKAMSEGKYDEWFRSEELKQQTSDRFKGRVWTEEQRKQISESLKGNIISDDQKNKISKSLKNKYEKGFVNKNQILKVSKRVSQHDLNGNFIKEFNSLHQAALAMDKKDAKQIRRACNGRRKNVYGYIWKFII